MGDVSVTGWPSVADNWGEEGLAPMALAAAERQHGELDEHTATTATAMAIALAEELGRSFEEFGFAIVRDHAENAPVHCVFIDEAQFLTEDQVWQLARIADRLGVPVMAYGLRTDFQGKLFPGSLALLAIADDLREVRTICRCGRKASMVVRLGPDGKVVREGDQVAIGGNDRYVSLCRRHWEEEMGRIDAEDMIGFTAR